MTIPTPIEFWSLNNTRVGAVNGTVLTSADGNDYYCDPGKILQGWQGNGSIGRSLGGSLTLPIDSPFSLSIWFRAQATANHSDGLLALEVGGLVIFDVRDQWTSLIRQISVKLWNSIKTVVLAKNTNWHCFVLSWNNAGTLQVYLDGTRTTFSGIASYVGNAVDAIKVARSMLYSNSGQVDAFGVWSVALSDAEAAEVYNAGAGWEYVLPADNTPDAFAFTAVTDADPATLYVSDSQEITGMDAGAAISITGGEYRLNGGSWTSDPGTIDPGGTLELRASSSAESEGVVTVTVTVGTLSVDWTITTGVLSSVVSNLIGSAIFGSRIFRSRIVRGHA